MQLRTQQTFLHWPWATECCGLWAAQIKEATGEQKGAPYHHGKTHARVISVTSLSRCRWQARDTMQSDTEHESLNAHSESQHNSQLHNYYSVILWSKGKKPPHILINIGFLCVWIVHTL